MRAWAGDALWIWIWIWIQVPVSQFCLVRCMQPREEDLSVCGNPIPQVSVSYQESFSWTFFSPAVK